MCFFAADSRLEAPSQAIASSAADATPADLDAISDVGSDTSELAVANSTSARDLDARLKEFDDGDDDSEDDSESLAYSSDCDGCSLSSDLLDFEDLEDLEEAGAEGLQQDHAADTPTALACSSICDGHTNSIGARVASRVSSVY